MNSSSSELSLTLIEPFQSNNEPKENECRDLFHPGLEIQEATVTLSSKEGCAFRVPAITLRMASGFFRAMLTLPQGQNVEETIHLEEPTRVVDTMLRIVCCVGIDVGCALAIVDDLSALLFAAEKYEMSGVISFARASILNPRFLQVPLQVYSICYRYGWTQEAQYAAQLTLALDFTEEKHRPALDSLSGASLMALLSLRWIRKAKLKAALEDPNTFQANTHGDTCSQCGANVLKGTKWRELKWAILDELERRPSGEGIKSNDFMQSAPAVALLDLKCQGCKKMCYAKDATVKHIFEAIDNLPTSI